MFAGYSTVHAGDVYHFIQAKMNQIFYSCDDQWLNKLWEEYYKVSPERCLKCFINPLEGPDEDYGQDHQDPPVIPNIEGYAEEDQEPENMNLLHLTHTVK